MDADFWIERWQKSQVGFHQADINPWLLRFWPALSVVRGSKVFVPLCGKSSDLLWLRDQGYQVLGVELSTLAVEAFFAENTLSPNIRQQDQFRFYETQGLSIACGDFFALAPAHLEDVSAVFDRASLIALPPAMRPAYAEHLLNLMKPGTQTLLVVIDYPQQQMPGPPFSVSRQEIITLYAEACEIELLHTENVLEQEVRFRDRGVERMEEHVFRLKRRA